MERGVESDSVVDHRKTLVVGRAASAAAIPELERAEHRSANETGNQHALERMDPLCHRATVLWSVRGSQVSAPEAPEASPRAPSSRVRIAILVLVLVGIFVAGKATGLTDSLGVVRIRELAGRAGPLGYLAYAGAFAVGELIHVPGILFVIAGVLAYGQRAGFVAGLLGGLLSVSTAFLVVRSVGGRALSTVRHPFMKRLLAHLDEHPIRTTFLLRSVFWFLPALNYALALSNIRFRHYFAGSLLGLVVPVALIAVFVERVLAWFG
jgi:uncharacterized membrane protein YdjX (TVP38/TMEM64 family)